VRQRHLREIEVFTPYLATEFAGSGFGHKICSQFRNKLATKMISIHQ